MTTGQEKGNSSSEKKNRTRGPRGGEEGGGGKSRHTVDQSGDRCADLGSEDGEIDVHFAEEEIEKRNEIETEIERGKDSFWRQLVGATGPETADKGHDANREA